MASLWLSSQLNQNIAGDQMMGITPAYHCIDLPIDVLVLSPSDRFSGQIVGDRDGFLLSRTGNTHDKVAVLLVPDGGRVSQEYGP